MNTPSPKKQHKHKSTLGKSLRTYALISQTILEAALILIFAILAGRYLDRHWLNTPIPWATLTGTLLGFTAMLWRLLQLPQILNTQQKRKHKHNQHNTSTSNHHP